MLFRASKREEIIDGSSVVTISQMEIRTPNCKIQG